VRPGLGSLDYAAFLREAARLDADLPVMLEHLPDAGDYQAAATHLRSVASNVGVTL
jgi:sugar phosphate isomerase/epimerase